MCTIVIPIIVTRAVPICCSRVLPVEYTGGEYIYMPFSEFGYPCCKMITRYKPDFEGMQISNRYQYNKHGSRGEVSLCAFGEEEERREVAKMKSDIRTKQFLQQQAKERLVLVLLMYCCIVQLSTPTKTRTITRRRPHAEQVRGVRPDIPNQPQRALWVRECSSMWYIGPHCFGNLYI